MKTTKLFVILDESNLEIVKDEFHKTMKFEDKKSAEEFASENLEIWDIIKVHFNHKFIQHRV